MHYYLLGAIQSLLMHQHTHTHPYVHIDVVWTTLSPYLCVSLQLLFSCTIAFIMIQSWDFIVSAVEFRFIQFLVGLCSCIRNRSMQLQCEMLSLKKGRLHSYWTLEVNAMRIKPSKKIGMQWDSLLKSCKYALMYAQRANDLKCTRPYHERTLLPM